MARKYKELRARMSPEARARAATRAKALLKEMPLHELRRARGLSQETLAATLKVRQASISKLERRADMYISTLRSHIEAMGGELEIIACFPDGEVRISNFEDVAAPGKGAVARGAAPESALSRLFRGRAQRRLEIAQPRAEAAVEKLRQRGVKARIVGSLARGSFRHTSDVDLLIEERGTLEEAAIEEIVRAEMGDFPFDLMYAERLPAGLREHVAGSR